MEDEEQDFFDLIDEAYDRLVDERLNNGYYKTDCIRCVLMHFIRC